MKRLTRDHLFKGYDLSTLPAGPALRVEQGEAFLIETVDTYDRQILSRDDAAKPNGPRAGNQSTGPVQVNGIEAGEVVAVRIEQLRVVGHCVIDTMEKIAGEYGYLLASEVIGERRDFIEIAEGCAHFPGGIEVAVAPMYGCFGVVPQQVTSEPGRCGGNMDIPCIGEGSTVHIRCERDGGHFYCGDGHALQGEGEANGSSLEVSLEGVLRIKRSEHQDLNCILIETPDSLVTVAVEQEFGDGVRAAVQGMSRLFAQQKGLDLLEAYQFVVSVGDLRLGAAWPMWHRRMKGSIPIPACWHIRKSHFA